MAGWTTHKGVALALPLENVDTDQIIPARFMSTPRSEGYGGFLLHDLRRDADGELRDMPLNKVEDASILVTRRNFGGGSSREAAVYALVDAGFRVVVAPSFGDIFSGNAVNNGLLPARVSDADLETLLAHAGESGAEISVDLERATLRFAATEIRFDLPDVARTKLINGWDDIDLTRAEAARIEDFRRARRAEVPWAWPAA